MGPPADAHVDPATVERVVGSYPVRLAVLFGSQVSGSATPASDVDVAVAFDESLSTEERHRARLGLTVDRMEALGTDDVDVADFATVRPAVGVSALRSGRVLVGQAATVEAFADRLESMAESRSHEERVRQFDELLNRLEEAV